jgi:hypothetical protein
VRSIKAFGFDRFSAIFKIYTVLESKTSGFLNCVPQQTAGSHPRGSRATSRQESGGPDLGSFDSEGAPGYIQVHMGNPLALKILSVLAVGMLLAHMSPAATGVLLCIGDGADPDCCSESHTSQSGASEVEQLQDGSDCGCCITVDAAPRTAGTTSQKASVEMFSGAGVCRNAVWPTTTRIAPLDGHDPGNPRLSSLRTVVLLI